MMSQEAAWCMRFALRYKGLLAPCYNDKSGDERSSTLSGAAGDYHPFPKAKELGLQK